MESKYQVDVCLRLAPKEMRVNLQFEANQLLYEGRCSLDQGVAWKRDETSNEGYQHKGHYFL